MATPDLATLEWMLIAEKAGTLIANIGYGPWQTAAWFNALCAQGSIASEKLRPNDRLVLRHWKTHLLYSDKLDEGDGDGDSTGTDGRRRWLKQLPQEEVAVEKEAPLEAHRAEVEVPRNCPGVGQRLAATHSP